MEAKMNVNESLTFDVSQTSVSQNFFDTYVFNRHLSHYFSLSKNIAINHT